MKMDNKDKVLRVIYKYWRYHCEHEDEEESLHEAIIQATLDEDYGEAYAEEIVVFKEDTAGNTYTEVYDRDGMDRYRHQHWHEYSELWEFWKDWEEPEVARKRQEEKQKKYEEYLNRTLTHEEMVEVLKKISNQNVEIFAYGKIEDNNYGVCVAFKPFIPHPVYSISEPYDQAPDINRRLHQKSCDEIHHIFRSIGLEDEQKMRQELFKLLKEAGLYREKFEISNSPILNLVNV